MFWIVLSMAAAFALELVLCLKLDSVLAKLTPVIVDLAAMLVCAALFLDGTLADFTWNGVGGNALLAALFFWGVALAVAMLLAWPVYGAVDYLRSRRQSESE